MQDQGIPYGQQVSHDYYDAMRDSFNEYKRLQKKGVIPIEMEFEEFLELQREGGFMEMAQGGRIGYAGGGILNILRRLMTPEAKRFITSAKVIGRKIKQKDGSAKVQRLASINSARSKDGAMTVKFTKITGPFTISFEISNK